MGYRRNLLAVTAASFIGFMGFTLVIALPAALLQLLGLTDVSRVAMWSGISLGVTPALTALLSPLWGRLADRFGRKIMGRTFAGQLRRHHVVDGVRDAPRGTSSRCAWFRASSPATAR